MALRWHDNFESWTTTPGTFSTIGSTPSISSGKFFCNSATQYGGVTLNSQATWIINMRVSLAGSSSSFTDLVTFFDGGTTQCSLGYQATTGKLAFYRGTPAGTKLGSDSSTTLTIDSGTYYDIEIKVTLHNSTGTISVKINGGADANLTQTGLDNCSTANNSADSIRFGGVANISNPAARFDHIIIMDSSGSAMNDFIGPVNVNTHYPTADGNYTTWTANTGDRWAAVDDTAPDSDTTYVSAASVGDKVTFALGNLPAGVTTVHALGVWVNSKRDDASSRGFKVLLRSSGSDQLGGTEHFQASSYGYFYQPFDVSPFTASAWGTSEVDGLEAGAQVTT